MEKKVIIIGGGVAGMQAAVTLAATGVQPVIVEREAELGGKLRDWHKLFPSFTPAGEVLQPLRAKVAASGAEVITGATVQQIGDRSVTLADGRRIEADAVMVCSGFDVFDARIKEEYGYGIYKNVFTTVDIERMMNEGKVATASGEKPRRIALLHCVGSRDEKVGQRHCSRVCCITGVKQAIELKEMFPDAEIYNFYMDIRMFGPGYEEMYRRAQQDYNIHFVRGRISEAAQTIDGGVQIKAEDTLVGRPLRMKVDMLILVVGMTSTRSDELFARHPAVDQYPSGFLRPRDSFDGNTLSDSPSIFYAGTVTAPKNVGESMNEGTAAAMKVHEYLRAE
ncbi:MAG: FAD-dependent oxidoreductase [Rikenellaceae bacterium]|jgi:heterodisulfide reductase subunit A|nr:FAD-dependent oxidoreductase [Rikenellaceae bacterium]